jgi:hypothetical protein
MFSTSFYLSVAATVTPMIGDLMLFGILFAIALIMFAAAIMRQTIIPDLLSSILWLVLAFAVWNFGDAASPLTSGSSIAFLGLGVVMLVVTFHAIYKSLLEAAAEKQRRVAEEVM